MASRVVTQLISDLSGDEIEDGGGETIEFSYRGASYSIDLTTDEAANFDAAMASYLEHATRVGGRRRSSQGSQTTTTTSDAKAIREWAQAHGIDVPARGRIPSSVREQYAAAN